jgi:hypothetical protein
LPCAFHDIQSKPEALFDAACDAVDGTVTGHMMFVPLLNPSSVGKELSCQPPGVLAVLQLVNAPTGRAFDFVDAYLVTSLAWTLSYAIILARYVLGCTLPYTIITA